MRIATFNILHGRSLDDGRVDVDRLAAAVKTLDADVLGLRRSTGTSRAPSGPTSRRWPPRRWAQPSTSSSPRWPARRAARGWPRPARSRPGRPSYGIALLSRYPVLSWRVVRLPALRAGVPMWSTGYRACRSWCATSRGSRSPRSLDGPFGEFTVCNTHLSFIPGWNALQLRRLMRSLAGTGSRWSLIGDLNMQRRQAARVSGMRPSRRPTTFPVDRPRRQLDHVLVRGALQATGPAEAVHLPLSDHRALVVPCGPA